MKVLSPLKIYRLSIPKMKAVGCYGQTYFTEQQEIQRSEYPPKNAAKECQKPG